MQKGFKQIPSIDFTPSKIRKIIYKLKKEVF